MKVCSKCLENKDESEFGKADNIYGLRAECKVCKSALDLEARRTKHGLVGKIYGGQRSSSKKRGHAMPTYTRKELAEWLYSQELFHRLYDNWKRLDYQKEYVPSVDRKDDFIGYSISNIQLMTWGENKDKQNNDILNGISTSGTATNVSVVQLDKNDEVIATYRSLHEAKRQTGVNESKICEVAKGRRKTAGGYKWRYENA